MAQSPLNYTAKNPSNALVPLQTDAVGSLLTGQGASSKLNVTAAAVIKVGSGRVSKVIVSGTAVGTGGTITLNDCATTGAAAAANAIAILPGATPLGSVVSLDFPFTTGLVVSAVPTGGTALQLSISYT